MAELVNKINNSLNSWEPTGRKLGIRRSKVFELWESGQLGSVRVGSKRFSTDRQIAEYIERLENGAA